MTRSERRHRTEVKQKEREKTNKRLGVEVDPGYYRDKHIGCGCWMCKPWKHDFYESKYKPSELRKLHNGKDDI